MAFTYFMEEIEDMTPKELKRDRSGLTRLQRIHRADKAMVEARIIAATVAHDPEGICQFAAKRRPKTIPAAISGLHHYRYLINRAAVDYAAAGLGLLSSRVEELVDGPGTDWAKFDADNATTGV